MGRKKLEKKVEDVKPKTQGKKVKEKKDNPKVENIEIIQPSISKNETSIDKLSSKMDEIIKQLTTEENVIQYGDLSSLSFFDLKSFRDILMEDMAKENYHGGNVEYRLKCGSVINKINNEINIRIDKYL